MLKLARRTILALGLSAFAFPALAVEMGDDGLHKTPWQRDTFKDLREDLEEANAEGKRLLVMIEQRGCIYCTKMHEEIYPDPEITQMIEDNFFVIQINMFGDVEVTDFDGESLPEKEMVQKWGALFTPTNMFFPEEVPDDISAQQAAVAVVPGAFGRLTTYNMMQWVLDHGYEGDEPFQKYHARQVFKQQESGSLAVSD
ncbi:thioredoxin family protein [Celeribacter litoreus]|uniref:thioredoxin family protein n=1 Tax=Celeribacter litoreus TaxID=2876714 RepID=UPI001CCB1ED6|nr:thioredoxin family protein [Celeribacter litoreus]MCA0044540.1 thioredoxin family protein [Celeribacter litoreus]